MCTDPVVSTPGSCYAFSLSVAFYGNVAPKSTAKIMPCRKKPMHTRHFEGRKAKTSIRRHRQQGTPGNERGGCMWHFPCFELHSAVRAPARTETAYQNKNADVPIFLYIFETFQSRHHQSRRTAIDRPPRRECSSIRGCIRYTSIRSVFEWNVELQKYPPRSGADASESAGRGRELESDLRDARKGTKSGVDIS